MHKKYTYKDGKRFGPYYYETKRVDGNVVTTYLGTKLPHKKIHISLIKNVLMVFAFLLLIASVYFISSNITGNALLDIKTNYNFGDSITGKIELNIFEGELIPADSVVLIEYGNFSKEFMLSDLISDDLLEGQFYAKGTSVSGSGFGYGLAGKIISYPLVNFDFYVFDGNENSQSNDVQDVPDQPSIEEQEIKEPNQEVEGQENQESSNSEEIVEEQTSESDSIEAGITGAVISESNVVSGVVSKEKEFTYSLNDGQTASLVEGSVNSEGVDLNDKVINFDLKNNEVLVTTDYFIENEGFGPDYIGDESKKIVLNLDQIGLIANQEDDLKIKLIYDSELIVEASDSITISNIELVEGVEGVEGNENQEGVSETHPIANNSILNETQVTNVTETNQTQITNVTEVNQTILNETQVTNVTKFNQTFINETLIEVKTTQYGAVIGQQVKWIKTISLELNDSLNLTVEVPASAENLTVNKISDEIESKDTDFSLENSESESDLKVSITGEVIADIDLSKESFLNKFFRLFGITGRVIEEDSLVQEVSLELNENDSIVEIEYYTGAPIATENMVNDNFKTILVSSPEDIHYENVLIYTSISDGSKIRNISSVRIEWVENNSVLNISSYNDTNSDGYIDYIEWVAPHLSNQTFNIILITSALHLNENREFISDIYNATRELDGYWSESISDGHYIRVVFERPLTSSRDISLFLKSSNDTDLSNISINVYENNGEELIAEFSNLVNDSYNKVYLSRLIGEQDTFDLLILGGNVEFDHIIDPNEGPGVFGLASPMNGSITTARSVNITMQINDTDWVSGSSGSITVYASKYSPLSYKNIIYGSIPFSLNGTISFNYSTPPLEYNSTQGMFLLYHFDNNTLYGENLTRVTDFATGLSNGTYTNVNGDRERSKDGLGLGYEVDLNEYALVQDNQLLNSPSTTGELTIMFWFNYSSASGYTTANYFLAKQADANNKDYSVFYLNSTRKLTFTFGNGSTERQIPGSTSINYNTWYHYAVTYNRSSGNVTIYLNGQPDASQIVASITNSLMDTSNNLAIGALSSGALTAIGTFDDVVLFNKTLNGAEIRDIYRLSEGDYYWNMNVSDNGGVSNSSPIYTFSVNSNYIPINVFNFTSPVNGSSTFERSVNVTLFVNDTNYSSGNSNLSRFYATNSLPFSYENIIYEANNFPVVNGKIYFNYSIPPLRYNSTQGMFLLYHFDNNTLYGENLTRVTDFATGLSNGTYTNVNGDRERSKDGLGLAYGVSSNERISLTDDTLLNSPSTTGELTIMFWFNMSQASAFTTSNHLIGKPGSGSGADYSIFFLNSTKTLSMSLGNGSTEIQVASNTAFSYDTWYHYVLTFNKTTRNTTIYVNGVVDKSQIATSITNLLQDTSATLHIGGLAAPISFIGLIDDVALFNKTLTASEILDIYRLKEGTYYLQANVSDDLGLFNATNIQTFSIISNNVPYNGTSLVINSTLGLNRTLENLNVMTSLLDLNNNSMNVTVRWYKDNLLIVTQMLNSSYANGSTFIATLGHLNTTKDQNWFASLTINDGISSFNVNSSYLTILNSLPNVTLISLINGSFTINRTDQIFDWVASDDDETPIDVYSLNISLVASSSCIDFNYNGEVSYEGIPGNSIEHYGGSFNCLIDNGDYYLWSVSAKDSDTGEFGPYSAPFNFSVQAYLNTILNVSSVSFGTIAYLEFNDTTDNSPQPIILVNEGNVLNNIKVKATDLWRSITNPSIYYKFKFANVSSGGISENGTFSWALTNTTYINMPNIADIISVPHLINLYYYDHIDSAEVDFNVTVPSTEGPGFKNSTIVFTIELGSGDTYV